MRTPITLAFVVAALAGCATSAPPQETSKVPPAPPVAPVTTTAPPTANLAFDPPAAAHTGTPDLSRDARAPSASNGTVESSTSQFNVTTSIQDNTTNGDFNQSTVTQQQGTVRH